MSNVKIDVADLKGYYGKSPLVTAAGQGDLDIVEYLISQQNVNINGRDDYGGYGETALIWASAFTRL